MIQSETPWTLDLGLVGGEHSISFSIGPMFSSSNVVNVLGRICPGRRVAHSQITITAASVLSTFDLVKKVDENGREIEPKREYSKSTAVR